MHWGHQGLIDLASTGVLAEEKPQSLAFGCVDGGAAGGYDHVV